MKSIIKNFINEITLRTYKKISPDFFPATWDVASDVERICKGKKPQTIFDVGANIGQMASYFHKRFPTAKIRCFEPIEESYTKLSGTFLGNQQIECFPLALGAISAEKTIILNPNSEQNSLLDGLTKLSSSEEKTATVKIESLDRFCQEKGIETIDLLKIDTEGYELEVLQGAKGFLDARKIFMILAEVGFNKGDHRHTNFTQIYEQLYQQGFRFYGLYDLSYWYPYHYEGLIYCNALFINANRIKSLI
jgi:FkbM family methyltransferase